MPGNETKSMTSDKAVVTDGMRIDPTAEPIAIRVTLEAIVTSEQLAKAERLKSFLSYVVEEAIAGRSGMILGKTIAQDVYGGDPLSTANAENLVRVDAGRLRRKMEDYYESDGANDRIKVVIEPGGYAPLFLDRDHTPKGDGTARSANPSRHSVVILLAAGALVAVLAVVAVLFTSYQGPSEDEKNVASAETSNTVRRTERDALALKSSASVQAMNLCDQARGFLFPIADPGGQKIAMETFTKAIDTDPGLSCGYAGAAHAAATLAILMGDTSEAEAMQQRAHSLSREAVELDPTDGWSQSSAAWAACAAGQFEDAETLSSLAVRLTPTDGNVLDFKALISLVLGDFDSALEASDPERRRDIGSFRFARRNLRAVAWFHTGNYVSSIRSLEEAIRNGDPVSPMTLTYLTASHWAAGNKGAAKKFASDLKSAWPKARPDIALSRFYRKEELLRQVVDRLVAAGWSPAP